MAYVTTAELREYLGAKEATDDVLLGKLLTRAQKVIESKLDRVFEASSNTTRYFDAVEDVDGDTLYLDEDLCEIESITNGDGVAVTSDQYVTEPRNDTPWYAIKLKGSSSVVWTYTDDPENAISISGKWAYSATPPAGIVHATLRLAAYYYKQRDAQVFDVTAMPETGEMIIPKGIPADVREILENGHYEKLI